MSLRKIMAAAALGGGLAMAPIAVSAADFSGKTVTIIVPFKEGGGASRYGRTWQPFLQQYLPGNPKVVVLVEQQLQTLRYQLQVPLCITTFRDE